MTEQETPQVGNVGRRSVFDRDPVEAEAQAGKRAENRAAFEAWIVKELTEGNDFGSIHITSRSGCDLGQSCSKIARPGHWSKNSLFKPGAEKVLDYFGLVPSWPNLVSYEERALAGEPINEVVLRCEAVDEDGFSYAQGIGGRELDQTRAGKPDVNKTLKMAKKASIVDCALTLGKLSGHFTQDIEEMSLEDSERGYNPKPKKRDPDAPGIKVPELTVFIRELKPDKVSALAEARYGKELKALSKKDQEDLLEWFRHERAVRQMIPQVTREDFDKIIGYHYPGVDYANLTGKDFDDLGEVLGAILQIQDAAGKVSSFKTYLAGFERTTRTTLFEASLIDLKHLLKTVNGAAK